MKKKKNSYMTVSVSEDCHKKINNIVFVENITARELVEKLINKVHKKYESNIKVLFRKSV